MKKIPLVFAIALLAYMVSCSLPDPGCEDYSCREKCEPTVKKHVKSIAMYVAIDCDYDSICMARYITFLHVEEFGWRRTADCYDGYEYIFVGDTIKRKILRYGNVEKIPLKDDHLRFSLFDEDDAEKKYDIDLSEIIHSYKYVGDSLEVIVPDYVDKLTIFSYNNNHGVINLTPASLENSKYVFFPDSLYKNVLAYDYTAKVDTPFGTDILEIKVDVYYR